MFNESDWILFQYRDWLNVAQDGRTKKWGLDQTYFPHPANYLRLLIVDRQSKMINPNTPVRYWNLQSTTKESYYISIVVSTMQINYFQVMVCVDMGE